jgi:hypothetical protein
MNYKLTVRLTDELRQWLRDISRSTGMSVSRLIREHLEDAKARSGKQRFMRHVGAMSGLPADLSSRKGFSRR